MQLGHNAIKIVLEMSEAQQRAVLRKYLLGELPESERSRLADRYFVDEELFDELLNVEGELLDQYARGRLAPEETKNFRKYLASLPDGSSKLATAYALKEVRNETISAPVSQPSPSRSRIFLPGFFNRTPLIQYASVAIVIGLLCGLVYLLIAQLTLRREVERLRAEQSHAEQESVNSAQQAQAAQENEAALRDRNTQLEQELSALKQTKRQDPQTALLVLTPALRSRAVPDSLTISNATQSLLLVMPVAKDEEISDYKAILKTTDGRLVLSRDRLRPRISDAGPTVSLSIPAAQLRPDTYKLTLQAEGTDIAQDFYFKVLKK